MRKIANWVKKISFADKLWLIALIAVLIVATFLGVGRIKQEQEKDIKDNINELTEAENADIISTEDLILKFRKNNNEENSIKRVNNTEIFNNTIFFGDSWAECMINAKNVYEYNILSKDNMEISSSENLLTKAIELNPENIVILLGNDTIKSVTLARFKTNYEKIIQTVKSKAPGIKIYICALSEIEKGNKKITSVEISAYNEILKELAEESESVYINTTEFTTTINGKGHPDNYYFQRIAEEVIQNITQE